MLHPIILTGGVGARLWPLSRRSLPKPLLALQGDETLLQTTVGRLTGLGEAIAEEVAAPTIITNQAYRFVVADQISELGSKPHALILEPEARNTAPAIAAACAYIHATDPEAIVLLLPADHIIEDVLAFHEAISRAVRTARRGYIVTFGITPDRPETGYGYIRLGEPLCEGAFAVESFEEKPDEATALSYLAQGDYFWNGGIFCARAQVLLDEMATHAPAVREAACLSAQKSVRDLDFIRLDPDAFSAAPAISIDYALMEKTDVAAVVPVAMRWSDVGSFLELWQLGQADASGNVCRGPVVLEQVSGSYVQAENRLVAAIGVTDLVIVETSDAVLVASRDTAESLRGLIDRMEAAGRTEHLEHRRVHRPWGSYETVDSGARFQVKRLIVKPGGKTSLQIHHHRSEHWVVVQGTAQVTLGDEEHLISENRSIYIPLGVPHSMHNPGRIPVHFIEVQSGSYLEEDDIVRLDDAYGRHIPDGPL